MPALKLKNFQLLAAFYRGYSLVSLFSQAMSGDKPMQRLRTLRSCVQSAMSTTGVAAALLMMGLMCAMSTTGYAYALICCGYELFIVNGLA
ncbi:MAG: hypothetical protein KME52_02340 [Desmonostoc geniculatum HA4340-LM1]|nr:hypothetical protein [Desmonostoc geniculatum HA4340-LM1]